MTDQPLVVNPDRDCRSCEFYTLERRPNDGPFAGRKPYCIGLGFYLFGNHAPDCKLFRPRPAVTTKPMGA